MPSDGSSTSARLEADVLFDRLFRIIQNARHQHKPVNDATTYLFWRIHNSYHSIRFLQASDPANLTLVDQHTIIRCMYEALLSLEHICCEDSDDQLDRATQYTLHIDVLLERDLLKSLPNLRTSMRQRIMSFFSSVPEQAIEHIKKNAALWRQNNKRINNSTRPDRTWFGKPRLADIARHHDEQYFMHTVFHHAVHTNYVPHGMGTYTPADITHISIMILARAIQALLDLHVLKASYNDKPILQKLCRPLDEQFDDPPTQSD
ncbi:MAG: DUF5677 domain-containing protein [Phycisphaerales bacterium JB043]